MSQEHYSIIMTTCNSEEVAEKLTAALLQNRLAACIQSQNIQSQYIWKGEIVKDSEILLYIKTRSTLYAEVEAQIKLLHNYEVPEIVEIPIHDGNADYFRWISQNTRT